ncbi:MAG: hypothetical protein V5B40_20555 [Candidatus Accumulibacter meliphilus]|uniref:hypothetical protein n=1 Tax=Candidatus Accumulibacter meliphilus TaxID=2211374 RepID=UPI002FC30C7C
MAKITAGLCSQAHERLADDKAEHYRVNQTVAIKHRPSLTVAWIQGGTEVLVRSLEELKIGFGTARMPCRQFAANAAFFRSGVIAQAMASPSWPASDPSCYPGSTLRVALRENQFVQNSRRHAIAIRPPFFLMLRDPQHALARAISRRRTAPPCLVRARGARSLLLPKARGKR